jgi:hypothetical protein
MVQESGNLPLNVLRGDIMKHVWVPMTIGALGVLGYVLYKENKTRIDHMFRTLKEKSSQWTTMDKFKE